MADTSSCSCPGVNVYRLRVVIAGISPLIWRRLEVTVGTTVAGLHAIVQTAFGWSGEHLHRFVIGGTEYGISYLGDPGFRDDARQVRLAGLGLREGERFAYEYNFFAAGRVDLRVEQIAWAEPHLVFDATVRAAEIIGQLLDAGEHHDQAGVGDCREELADLAPAAGSGAFRPAGLQPSPARPGPGRRGEPGMKVSVQVIVPPDDTEASPVVREVFTLDRDDLAPDTLGLQLAEAKDLLAAVQDTLVEQQATAAIIKQVACPHCGRARRHKDMRTIVVASLFGALRLASPRWWHCGCRDQPIRTFQPLAGLLPERTTPEVAYLQARFAALVSYGITADLLGELLPLAGLPKIAGI